MPDTSTRLRVRRITCFVIALGVLLVSLDAAAQNTAGNATSPTASEPTLAELRVEVAQLKGEFDLRQQVAALRTELQSRTTSQSGWVESAPWLAFAAVGIAFSFAWFKRTDADLLKSLRDRVVELEKSVKSLRLSRGPDQ